ncbi:fibrinogen-binding adhesin SdrG C-terminal domain-containing protein [Staphylococcus pseudintermedius]|nr:fibrinogen-binding adhesin SdrG C-terminal domain-containing protein [Staphylococcus pseudintermedius]WMZ45502.1 fibrinogen-binding adhesin SdrG C-terminal domain-containing protein [Staphylococcus pseudintermedius]
MDSQNSEQIIAYGEINEKNRVRYRFMDYVNQKENLKGKLSLNLFIKPDKVQDEGKITVTSQLGKEMTSQEFDIKYIDGVKSPSGITLNGRLDELSKADQSFTHYAIFKPKHNNLTNVTLRGTVSNNAQQNEKNGQVKVYEYIGQGELPQSAYANVKDTNQFRDITNSLRPTTVNSTGYQITFDHINKKPYVIVYKGHYKNEAKDLEFTTNATDYHSSNLYSYNYWPYYGSFNLTWKNGVAFYSNKANVKKVPNIVDTQNNDTVIAFGEINEQNRVRYRFTDYVSKKDNVKGNLSLNLFIDPSKVLNNGNTTVSSILNGTKTESTFNIEYIDGIHNAAGVTLNGRLDELSKANQTFTHFATFKPKHNKLSSVTIKGKVKNGVLQNSNNGEVKVYEFIGNGELPQSVYANVNDTNQFKDITTSMNSKKSNGTGYEITFDMMNDKPYVILYKGYFDSNSKDFDFTTNATGYQNLNQSSYYYWPYNHYFNLTWDNGVAFYSNNASGEGNDKPVPPTYGFSELVDTTQNTAPATMTFQTTGVLEEIEDSVVLNTLSQSGEDRSENTSPIIETTEDSQPVEFEEETNHGIQDVTLHADAVDFEEETNHGEQDTVHHSDVVEYDEDTTTGMLTGAISDHTTEEDTMEYTTDGLLIEFDDEMNPNVSGQYDDITTDTIEESSHIDTFTELESEFGQHDGIVTFEEDTIVEKPKTEKGNRVPLVIDLSTPKHNHQFNIQPTDPNIDTSATYRIGDFVWRDPKLSTGYSVTHIFISIIPFLYLVFTQKFKN